MFVAHLQHLDATLIEKMVDLHFAEWFIGYVSFLDIFFLLHTSLFNNEIY